MTIPEKPRRVGRPTKESVLEYTTAQDQPRVRRYSDDEERARELEKLRISGQLKDGVPFCSFDDALSQHIERQKLKGREKVKAKSTEVRSQALKKVFAGKSIRALTAAALEDLRDNRLDEKEWSEVRPVVRALVKFAISKKWIPEPDDPLRLMSRQRRTETKLIRTQKKKANQLAMPSLARLDAIQAACKGWLHVAVSLFVHAGVRSGEARELRKKDLSFDDERSTVIIKVRRAVKQNGEVGPPKTAKGRRTIRVQGPLYDLLKELVEGLPDDGLLVADEGQRIQGQRLRLSLYRAQAAAGLGRNLSTRYLPKFEGTYGPHDLRHACAASWIWRRVPLKVMQRWLGHLSPTMTMEIYGYLIEAFEAGDAEWPLGPAPEPFGPENMED